MCARCQVQQIVLPFAARRAFLDWQSNTMSPYHAKLWATFLRLRGGEHGSERLGHSLATAKVDLNPHQVGAAVFAMQALRLGGPRGALLADEVGLGKTIEAGLVLAQYWAEGRRNLLLIVPAMLRKQWQAMASIAF
jgi:adenine-specific DNA-methyltransferase